MGWQSHKKLEPYRASKSESGAGNRTDSGSSIKRENRTTTLKNSDDPDLQQNRLLLSHFYLCRATHYSFTNELQLQEVDLEQAVELARQSEDKLTLANALSARADMYSFRGLSADSLVFLFEALEVYKSIAHGFEI